jgi:hypothetical protein
MQLDAASISWLKILLDQQACVVVEPWLNKLIDLSVHARIQPDGKTNIAGITAFLTTPRGQYAGSIIGPKSLNFVVKKLCATNPFITQKQLVSALETSALHSSEQMSQVGYYGPFSQDAFIYASNAESSDLKLRNLVEINARLSMGRVALEIGKHIDPSAIGWMYLVNRRAMELAGCQSLRQYADQISALSPTRLSSIRGQNKLIKQGAVWITDPYTSKDFMIMLLVGTDLLELKTLYPEACRLFPDWLVL